MKFRKRPVVIDAIQWTGANPQAIIEFIADAVDFDFGSDPPTLAIRTLEGIMTTSVGDWIIRGVKGELYLCKPDTFDTTYDAVLPLPRGRVQP